MTNCHPSHHFAAQFYTIKGVQKSFKKMFTVPGNDPGSGKRKCKFSQLGIHLSPNFKYFPRDTDQSNAHL